MNHVSPAEDASLDPDSVSSRTIVDLGALSHRGKVRPNNEDSFLVTRLGRSLTTLITNLPNGCVPNLHAETGYAMLVADGMGGAAGGEIASQTAIKALIDLAIQTPDWILNLSDQRADQVLHRMEERFAGLKGALTECIRTDPGLAGMGTTMTLAISLGADLVIAHVGDSRVYLFTYGQLVRLTKDQTMAQLLADLGVIRPEDVDKHHARNVLTSAIMADGQKAEVELHHLRLADGDRLLLCSDGLTEMVSDAEIAAVLEKGKTAMESCQTLVDLALEAGGKDNITVVLAGYQIPTVGE
jgi:PPM family protein phosphatase